ncbi:hypothetical protein OIU76_026569 [Salix suchowensis]|nr:hypothetical protein OIU76_026569 [Salix suchowensis]
MFVAPSLWMSHYLQCVEICDEDIKGGIPVLCCREAGQERIFFALNFYHSAKATLL